MDVGVSTCLFPKCMLTEEICRLMAEARLENVELLGWFLENEEYYKYDLGPDYYEMLASYGVHVVSGHPRFRDFSSPTERVRQRAVAYAIEDLDDFAKAPGCRLAVLHPSGNFKNASERPARFKNSLESLKRVVDHARKVGIEPTVENMLTMPCMIGDTPEELMELAEKLGVQVCIDLGHANCTSGVLKWLDVCKPGLRAVHVHDSRRTGGTTPQTVGDDHLFPGSGGIDWQEVFEGLEATGYDSMFMYEVGQGVSPFPDLGTSLKYLREFFDTRGRCVNKARS